MGTLFVSFITYDTYVLHYKTYPPMYYPGNVDNIAQKSQFIYTVVLMAGCVFSRQ